jgi:hypothetical protein
VDGPAGPLPGPANVITAPDPVITPEGLAALSDEDFVALYRPYRREYMRRWRARKEQG